MHSAFYQRKQEKSSSIKTFPCSRYTVAGIFRFRQEENNEATVEDIKNSYELAWKTGCKAVTVYRDGSKSLQVLETGKNNNDEESSDESDNSHILLPRNRPTVVNGLTERIRSGHGTMFVTVNFDQNGNPLGFVVFSSW